MIEGKNAGRATKRKFMIGERKLKVLFSFLPWKSFAFGCLKFTGASWCVLNKNLLFISRFEVLVFGYRLKGEKGWKNRRQRLRFAVHLYFINLSCVGPISIIWTLLMQNLSLHFKLYRPRASPFAWFIQQSSDIHHQHWVRLLNVSPET